MIVHATTVAVGGVGLLIRGESGAGKSSLALQMLALGAGLVADDRTYLTRPDGGAPLASVPETIAGLIEARGLGLIRVAPVGPVRLAAVLDLSVVEPDRLPENRSTEILGAALPLLYRVDAASFPAALVLWLRSGADSLSRLS